MSESHPMSRRDEWLEFWERRKLKFFTAMPYPLLALCVVFDLVTRHGFRERTEVDLGLAAAAAVLMATIDRIDRRSSWTEPQTSVPGAVAAGVFTVLAGISVPQARAAYAAAYATDSALTAGFDLYRAFAQDAKDNAQSAAAEPVATPLLYVRGKASSSDIDDYLDGFRRAGVENIHGATIPDAGHFLADEQPEALWAVLSGFAA